MRLGLDRIEQIYAARSQAARTANAQYDDVLMFFVNCYYLVDWIDNDPAVATSTRRAARNLVRRHPELRLCADLTDRWTDAARTKPSRSDDAATGPSSNGATAMFGVGHTFRVSGHGVESDARDLARQCVSIWELFMANHNLML